MSFFPPERDVPEILETRDFVLVPLNPSHVEIDYDAVMSSREMLRLWSGSAWPRDDFTLAENLADLAGHDREHRERIAFTFTVLNNQLNLCLGCVYMRPLSDLQEANAEKLSGIRQDEAITRFWVRTALMDTGFDMNLLKALIGWYETSWPFSRLYFHTRSANTQQVSLFEAAGLTRQWTLHYAQRGGRHHFYRTAPTP